MKQTFGAEAIGLTPQEARRWSDPEMRRRANREVRPRVEELTGVMLNGMFLRRRLVAKADYTHANARGTRGVWLYWVLECGPLYWTRYRTTWTDDWRERYLTLDARGRITDITEEEARQWLISARPQNAGWASMS